MFRCSLLQLCCHVYGTGVNDHAFFSHESSSQKQLRASLNYCQAKSGQDQDHNRVHMKKTMIDVVARTRRSDSRELELLHPRIGELSTYFKNIECPTVYQRRGALFLTINFICLYDFLVAAVRRRARSKVRISILIGQMYNLM